MADAAFELGQGEAHIRRTAGALRKVWENLALSEEWALLLAQSQTPINPRFGGGEKTRKVAHANALPDVEFDDGDYDIERPGSFLRMNDNAGGGSGWGFLTTVYLLSFRQTFLTIVEFSPLTSHLLPPPPIMSPLILPSKKAKPNPLLAYFVIDLGKRCRISSAGW